MARVLRSTYILPNLLLFLIVNACDSHLNTRVLHLTVSLYLRQLSGLIYLLL